MRVQVRVRFRFRFTVQSSEFRVQSSQFIVSRERDAHGALRHSKIALRRGDGCARARGARLRGAKARGQNP